MQLLPYNYVGPQNRLDNVADPATGGMEGQSAGNYAYDEIGNLVKDETEEIAEIKWTVYGKVRAVVREAGSTKPDLDFAYTASGQRYLKVVKPKNPDGSLKNLGFWTFTYYQHDAQGNVLAVYDIKNADEECGYEMYLDQLVLYGSSRLGVLNQKLKMGTMEHSFPGYGGGGMYVCLDELVLDDDLMLGAVPATSPGEIFDQSPGGKIEGAKPWELVQNPATVKPLTVFGVTNPPINVAGPAKEETKYEPGHKQYEFSNHLGNVLVTVSDLPLGVDVGTNGTVDYYMPNVLTTSDYEPFGAPLEGRTLSENAAYLFAFNGKERDDEGMGGGGSTYDYGFRIYNPQIAKFLSVDPLTDSYPWYTPYQFSGNKPIWAKDLDGLEESYSTAFFKTIFGSPKGYVSPTTPMDYMSNIRLQKQEDFANSRTGKFIGGAWNFSTGVVGTFASIGYITETGGVGAPIGGVIVLQFSIGEVGIGIAQMVDALYSENMNNDLQSSSSIPGLIAYGSGSDNAAFIDAAGQFMPSFLGTNPFKLKNILESGFGIIDAAKSLRNTPSVAKAIGLLDQFNDVAGFALESYKLVNYYSNGEFKQQLFYTFSYTVQSGDNINDIARKFETTVDAIITQNGLKENEPLIEGQKIIFKGGSKGSSGGAGSSGKY